MHIHACECACVYPCFMWNESTISRHISFQLSIWFLHIWNCQNTADNLADASLHPLRIWQQTHEILVVLLSHHMYQEFVALDILHNNTCIIAIVFQPRARNNYEKNL